MKITLKELRSLIREAVQKHLNENETEAKAKAKAFLEKINTMNLQDLEKFVQSITDENELLLVNTRIGQIYDKISAEMMTGVGGTLVPASVSFDPGGKMRLGESRKKNKK